MNVKMKVATEASQADPATQLWYCTVCEWVYDPADGDPDGGIPPGTAFQDISDRWVCPDCGARKKQFRLMEPGDEFPAHPANA